MALLNPSKLVSSFVSNPILDSGFRDFITEASAASSRFSELSSLSAQINSFIESSNSLARTVDDFVRQSNNLAKDTGPYLCEAGFWVVLSSPLSLLRALRELIEEGEVTPEKVRQLFVDFYSANDFYYLKLMVQDWENHKAFSGRMEVISDALDAHIDGKYTLSIPAILPIIEGILTEILGKRDRKMEEWAKNAIEEYYTDYLQEASRDAVIAYITGAALYVAIPPQYFTSERYVEWLKQHGMVESQVLQRHAILHGVQKDYASKENSLRAFLLLDILASLSKSNDERNDA